MNTTTRTLIRLAALTWYTGALVLVIKALWLLIAVHGRQPDSHWIWISTLVGLLGGLFNAKFIFIGKCRENLDRIATLTQPKLWQFFRLRFFVALALMILAGAIMSTMAQTSDPGSLSVASIDLSLGFGLLGSSVAFWTKRS